LLRLQVNIHVVQLLHLLLLLLVLLKAQLLLGAELAREGLRVEG
jgi:hypothetical protein